MKRSVIIRPLDEEYPYLITEAGPHTVTFKQILAEWKLSKYENPILISRHDWNLYVSAAILCGFDAIAHYERAQQNKRMWDWDKKLFSAGIASSKSKASFLTAMYGGRGHSKTTYQDMLNKSIPMPISQENLLGKWTPPDRNDTADAMAATLHQLEQRTIWNRLQATQDNAANIKWDI